ncbi:MAG: DUF4142 domain-containing protein [Acetobacteraceae bacterium]|nr:DUF4142 domain-containing protein [Acetobacteraceae bacterium]
MRTTVLLAGAIAASLAASAHAQNAPDRNAQSQAEPPATTGRTEESARITGTAGERAEVLNAPEFARLAATGGMFEIQSGRLALDRTQRRELRDFAQQMVNDHTGFLDQLRGMVQQDAALHGVQMPQDLDPQRQGWMEELRAASGKDFDDPYIQSQREALLIEVDMFRNYAEAGDNTQLRQWAGRMLPVLKRQLEKIQSIRPT